uniref:Putative secreted protein n=1 Tax=Xenopsylla cheopis TaxID=163159 RepID=A0A6M2DXV4_XENCH
MLFKILLYTSIILSTNAASLVVKDGLQQNEAKFYTLPHINRVLCYFAANGRWPPFTGWFYPNVVLTGNVFWTLNDPSVRATCSGITQVIQVYRPFGAPRPIVVQPRTAAVTTRTTTIGVTSSTTTEGPKAAEPTESSDEGSGSDEIDARSSEEINDCQINGKKGNKRRKHKC